MQNPTAKQIRHKTPKRQHVRWAPPEAPAGIFVVDEGSDEETYISWETLKSELESRLLPLLFQEPAGFTFEVRDLKSKKDWLVRLCDASGAVVADVWFGGNPVTHVGDGLIRIGAAGASPDMRVWQTYERYANGTYRRVEPSPFWSLEAVPENLRAQVAQ